MIIFSPTAPTVIYTLSLHDALPISWPCCALRAASVPRFRCIIACWTRAGTRYSSAAPSTARSEEHTSELQSRRELVCRLLLEKKKTPGTKILELADLNTMLFFAPLY